MTLSAKGRQNYLYNAFEKILSELKDFAIDTYFFNPTIVPLNNFPLTTWADMREEGWITNHDVNGVQCFRLTGIGWLEALRVTEWLYNDEYTRRMGIIAAALKNKVKTRNSDVTIPLKTITDESGLPEGWIFNAIDSRLIEERWKRYSGYWLEKGRLLFIPANCGSKKHDLTIDARDQLQNVKSELNEVKNELSEFICPYCAAPLVYRTIVSLSEDVDGEVEGFACGYSSGDGNIDSPCPSSSLFPKYSDYEVKTDYKEVDKPYGWLCYGIPKTYPAQKLLLGTTRGKTEQEARDNFFNKYLERAKRWER